MGQPLSLSTGARSEWLGAEGRRLQKAWIAKYLTGAIEHHGDLGEVSLLDLLKEMEQEHLDALSYIAELRRRVLNEHVVEVKSNIPPDYTPPSMLHPDHGPLEV